MENTSRSLPRRDDETEIEETVATTLEPSGLSSVIAPWAGQKERVHVVGVKQEHVLEKSFSIVIEKTE
jgi:hypothetical protein